MSRFKLQEALGEKAVAMGVKVLWGCQVDRIDTETPSVLLKSGEVLRADLIVGADGASSCARPETENAC